MIGRVNRHSPRSDAPVNSFLRCLHQSIIARHSRLSDVLDRRGVVSTFVLRGRHDLNRPVGLPHFLFFSSSMGAARNDADQAKNLLLFVIRKPN